jgi:hypothetical protein
MPHRASRPAYHATTMKQSTVIRWLVILVLGAVLGMWGAADRARWVQRGQEAFLAHEIEMFEHLYSRPVARNFVVQTLLVWLSLGAYEGLVALFVNLFGAKGPTPKAPSAPGEHASTDQPDR